MGRSPRAPSPVQPPVTRRADTTDLPAGGTDGPQPELTVLYTTHAGTLAALKIASRLRVNLGTHPRVLMLYAVPYTLPLGNRGVPAGYLEKRIRALRRESPTEIQVEVHLCRDQRQGLGEILPPHSLVVLGGKMRWWPAEEQRLARILRKEGHTVLFAILE